MVIKKAKAGLVGRIHLALYRAHKVRFFCDLTIRRGDLLPPQKLPTNYISINQIERIPFFGKFIGIILDQVNKP